MDSAKAESTRILLAAIWQRSLPTLFARLESLDAAAVAAESGPIPAPLHEQALSNAHKLSGSLGMFGYLHGTSLAREIEQLLESASPDAATFCTLARALRTTISAPA